MTELLKRSFEVAAVEVAGRTVDVRIVPFGEVARVADPPDWEPYDEEWLPGCFDNQLSAANRIKAKYGHSDQVTNVVGQGVALRSEQDGYHLTATIHTTNAGDTTLELLRADAEEEHQVREPDPAGQGAPFRLRVRGPRRFRGFTGSRPSRRTR
jgi:phage head maturation protease